MLSEIFKPRNRTLLISCFYGFGILILVLLGFRYGFGIVFPFIMTLFIMLFNSGSTYKYVKINDGIIHFDNKINIPLKDINQCISHFSESKYSPSYFYFVDKFGRYGIFNFYLSYDDFEELENSLKANGVPFIRFHLNSQNIHDAYQ